MAPPRTLPVRRGGGGGGGGRAAACAARESHKTLAGTCARVDRAINEETVKTERFCSCAVRRSSVQMVSRRSGDGTFLGGMERTSSQNLLHSRGRPAISIGGRLRVCARWELVFSRRSEERR